MNAKLAWLVALAALSLLMLAGCSGGQGDGADSALIQQGKLVFQANCSACHSTTPGVTIVGPTLAGIATRAGEIVSGLDARAYLEQSIIDPGAYLTEGFKNLMPDTYGNSISEKNLDALISYMLTFD